MKIQDIAGGTRRKKDEAPLSYAVIDVETGDPANLKEIVKQEMEEWTPPTNWVDKNKIRDKKETDEIKKMGAGGLMDDAPIVTIAIYSAGHGACLSAAPGGKGRIASKEHENAFIYRDGSEEKMLIHLRDMLNDICTLPTETTEGTMIMGHNIINFDLPRMRLRCPANGIKMPDILCCGIGSQDQRLSPVFDTMRIFTRFYSCKDIRYISLDRICDLLGIESPKNGFSGADVPVAWKEKKYSKVEEYCLGDAKAEEQVALLMMNQHPALV